MPKSFVVTFKTPDAIADAINEWAKSKTVDIENEEEQDEKYFELMKEATEFADKFTRYGEYINVQFDLDAKQVTIV